MPIGGASPNQSLLFVLMDSAVRNTSELSTYWTVQHRHADGHRWVDVAHYVTEDDAWAAVARAHEQHPDEELRVEHVRR